MATNQQQKQARRRLRQLGKALSDAQAGWSDSEEDELVHEGNAFFNITITLSKLNRRQTVNVKSVRIGDVVMAVTPAENPELVPEHLGPFYEGSQVKALDKQISCRICQGLTRIIK